VGHCKQTQFARLRVFHLLLFLTFVCVFIALAVSEIAWGANNSRYSIWYTF